MSQPGPRWGEFEPQPSSSSPAPSYSPLLSLPTFPGAGGGRPCFRDFRGAGPGALPPPGGGGAGPRSRPGAPRRLPGGAAGSGVPAPGCRAAFFWHGAPERWWWRARPVPPATLLPAELPLPSVSADASGLWPYGVFRTACYLLLGKRAPPGVSRP